MFLTNEPSMEEPQTIHAPIAKPRFVDLTNVRTWKNNLPFLVIVPYILGGIWQIIELSSISLTYIRFFSVTQSVSDGLLMLVIVFLFVGLWLIWSKRSITERIVRKWLMVETTVDVNIIVLMLTCTLSIIILSPLLTLFAILDETGNFVLLIMGLVLWISIFLSKDRYKNSQSGTLFQKAKISIFQWARFVLILGFIGYLIGFMPTLFNRMRASLTNLKQNINILEQEKCIVEKSKLKDDDVEVTYFNDQFIFWEINALGKKYVLVTSFGDTFNTDSLPDIQSHIGTFQMDSMKQYSDEFEYSPN